MSFQGAFRGVLALAGAIGGAVDCSRASTATTSFSEAILFGTVVDSTGSPVAGATVQARGYRLSCEDGIQDGDGSPTLVLTNADGSYRQRVVGFLPAEHCVVVTVVPPNGSGLRPGTSMTRVGFRPRASPPYDSVRVDVVLR